MAVAQDAPPGPARWRIITGHIAWHETDLRERAKRLGALWRPAQTFWDMGWASVDQPFAPVLWRRGRRLGVRRLAPPIRN